MSHDATNWAIKQRGLKPTGKIVLWHLCDRFNPDYGCFPSQPTRYILGFEPGFTPNDPTPCPETGHGLLDAEVPIAETDDPADDHLAASEPCLNSGHGEEAGTVSDFDPDPCPEIGPTRVRNPDTNLVREPLSKPVKEEEDAQARDADFDRFFAELLSALGFAANARLPGWWQGEPARTHVRRWMDDLGLSEDRIVEVARSTRDDHPNPPDGPKALDRFMERAARRDAQPAANPVNARRGRKTKDKPPPSLDELAAFYAARVNSDEYLPASMISNTMCAAMLARGLVTPERLRMRGVL